MKDSKMKPLVMILSLVLCACVLGASALFFGAPPIASAGLATMSAGLAMLGAALASNFAKSGLWFDRGRHPRSIFETRRAGLA
jgi:hypothetical protein